MYAGRAKENECMCFFETFPKKSSKSRGDFDMQKGGKKRKISPQKLPPKRETAITVTFVFQKYIICVRLWITNNVEIIDIYMTELDMFYTGQLVTWDHLRFRGLVETYSGMSIC